MKTYTLEEVQDKLIGEKGTAKRTIFEMEIQNDPKPNDNFLSSLVAPARRALENKGISTLEQLSKYSKKEVLSFHGMGKSSIPKLEKLLSDQNMSFRLS
jgi:hypothetical protein